MSCVLCGKCMEACPLLLATGKEELAPRAKANLVALLEDDSEFDERTAAKLLALCMGCGRCVDKCTQGQNVPGMVSQARADHRTFRERVWKLWLTKARNLWGTSGHAAKFLPENLTPEKLGPLMKMLVGLKEGAGFESFVSVDTFPDLQESKPVLLFSGCTARYVRKDWVAKCEALIEGLGMKYFKADFECCGSPLKTAGFAEHAASAARKNVEAWRGMGRCTIAVPCASCLHGLHEYDREIFADDDEYALWQRNLKPISELLRGATFVVNQDAPENVAYHRPCHVDKQDYDLMLLNDALGQRLLPVSGTECCGFGGVMRLTAPDLCDTVNDKCLQVFEGAEIVLTGCSACAAQLGATVHEPMQAGHWLDMMQ